MDLISFDNLTLELNNCGKAAVDRNWSHINRRKEPWVRLHVVEKGQGAVLFNGKRYEMVPGVIHCVPPITDHEYICDHYMEVYAITFRCELPGGISLFSVLDMPCELPCSEPLRFFEAISRLEQLKGSIQTAAKMEVWSLLLQIQLPFIRAASGFADAEFSQNYQRFEPVLSLIEKRLPNPPRLDELAAILHLSPVYFSNFFCKVFGVPPSRYILERRIQAGKVLLSSTNDTIDRIGRNLGFVDGYHFSKAFKKITAQSPSKFRAEKGLF